MNKRNTYAFSIGFLLASTQVYSSYQACFKKAFSSNLLPTASVMRSILFKASALKVLASLYHYYSIRTMPKLDSGNQGIDFFINAISQKFKLTSPPFDSFETIQLKNNYMKIGTRHACIWKWYLFGGHDIFCDDKDFTITILDKMNNNLCNFYQKGKIASLGKFFINFAICATPFIPTHCFFTDDGRHKWPWQ